MPEPFGSREGNRVVIGGVALHQLGDCVFDCCHEGVDELASHGQVSRSVVDDDRANALGLR